MSNRREISKEEKEMMRSLLSEKLKILTTSLDQAISKIFKKRMAFGLIMFDHEGENKSHLYVSNVIEKDDFKNALLIVLDMIEHPEKNEEGFINKSKPTIQ